MMRYLPKSLLTLFVVVLSGCAISSAIIDVPQEYLHQIDYSLDGVLHSAKTRLSCTSAISVFSAADGRFHNQWTTRGYNPEATLSLADGSILIYRIEAPCNQEQKDYPIAGLLIEDLAQPDHVVVIDNDHEMAVGEHKFKILMISSRRATSADKDITKSPNQAQRDITNYRERIYENVEATIIPESVWGSSDEARAYFSQLKVLTVAEQTDALAASRVFPLRKVFGSFLPNAIRKKYLVFRLTEFHMPTTETAASTRYWYATGQKRAGDRSPYNSGVVHVVYKGLKLELRTSQEIYDPETRELISFFRSTKLTP